MPIFHSEFAERIFHVFLNGRQAALQYVGNFPVLFAFGDPEKHL